MAYIKSSLGQVVEGRASGPFTGGATSSSSSAATSGRTSGMQVERESSVDVSIQNTVQDAYQTETGDQEEGLDTGSARAATPLEKFCNEIASTMNYAAMRAYNKLITNVLQNSAKIQSLKTKGYVDSLNRFTFSFSRSEVCSFISDSIIYGSKEDFTYLAQKIYSDFYLKTLPELPSASLIEGTLAGKIIQIINNSDMNAIVLEIMSIFGAEIPATGVGAGGGAGAGSDYTWQEDYLPGTEPGGQPPGTPTPAIGNKTLLIAAAAALGLLLLKK